MVRDSLGEMTKKITVNMVSESEFSVQGHGVHTAFVEITKALRARDDVDVRVNSNEPADIVHVQTVGPYAIRRLISKKYKARFISAHVVPASFVGSLRGAKFWAPLSPIYLKWVYSRAHKVLACSGLVKVDLDKMKVPEVVTFYNSIDMANYATTAEDRAAAREQLGIGPDEFVVVGNGQVQPRKRVDILIDMAERHPEMRFFWAGGIPFKNLGAEAGKMQHLMENHPSNMTITGVIPLEDVKAYYQAADVFVLPAEQENHPMCVLEAAGAGLPIVLRDIPNYKDTFKDDALLAATDGDFETLILSVRDDPSVREEYARRAGSIADRFDSAAAAERLVGMYRHELIKQSVARTTRS